MQSWAEATFARVVARSSRAATATPVRRGRRSRRRSQQLRPSPPAAPLSQRPEPQHRSYSRTARQCGPFCFERVLNAYADDPLRHLLPLRRADHDPAGAGRQRIRSCCAWKASGTASKAATSGSRRVTNFATGADRDKPALWVDGNIHATEVAGLDGVPVPDPSPRHPLRHRRGHHALPRHARVLRLPAPQSRRRRVGPGRRAAADPLEHAALSPRRRADRRPASAKTWTATGAC